MMKNYNTFRNWAEQKRIQKTLNYLIFLACGFVVLIAMFGLRSQLGLLAGMTKENVLGVLAAITPTSSPTPKLSSTPSPTDTPTEIPTYIPKPQQIQYAQPQTQTQQAPTTINCNITANVPDSEVSAQWYQLTPEACAAWQAHAVILYNQTVGNQQQQTQFPVPQYQPVQVPQANIPVPPTLQPAPILQQPQVHYQPLPQQAIPSPTKTCTVIWQGGIQVPVCY